MAWIAPGRPQPSSAEDEEAPATSLMVGPGETIQTQKHAAIANLQGNGNMRLAPNSQVQLPPAAADGAPPAQASLSLQSGRVMLNIALDPSHGQQEVIINGQAMSVGMKEGKLFVETGDDGSEIVGVHQGEAAVTKEGKTAKVESGEMLEIDANGRASLDQMPPDVRRYVDQYPDHLLRWEERAGEWGDWKAGGDNLSDSEVQRFRDDELGRGTELVFESTGQSSEKLVATVEFGRMRDRPMAVEFWIQMGPDISGFTQSLSRGSPVGSHKYIEPWYGKWKRMVLPCDPFPPEGTETERITLYFAAQSYPANTQCAIRVIPGRVLVLKE